MKVIEVTVIENKNDIDALAKQNKYISMIGDRIFIEGDGKIYIVGFDPKEARDYVNFLNSYVRNKAKAILKGETK